MAVNALTFSFTCLYPAIAVERDLDISLTMKRPIAGVQSDAV